MNKSINVVEQYKPKADTLQTAITIKLRNGKEVYALFEHEQYSPYLITNEELIDKLRALANHIEINHA